MDYRNCSWVKSVLSGKTSSILEVAKQENKTPKEIRDEILEINKINPGLSKKLLSSLGISGSNGFYFH